MSYGTGSQVFHLARLGYKVVGSDFSLGLIKIAREKALKITEGVSATGRDSDWKEDIKFVHGDVRNLKVGEFDAVITIDKAIGHLVQADFEIAIRNIARNLKKSGFYIFDILNLEAMTDEVIKADTERISDKKIATDEAIIYTKRHLCSVDKQNGYISSEEEIRICKNNEKKIINNKCTLKIYTMEQLKDILSRNGFQIVEQYKVDAYTFKQDNDGYSILTITQKIA